MQYPLMTWIVSWCPRLQYDGVLQRLRKRERERERERIGCAWCSVVDSLKIIIILIINNNNNNNIVLIWNLSINLLLYYINAVWSSYYDVTRRSSSTSQSASSTPNHSSRSPRTLFVEYFAQSVSACTRSTYFAPVFIGPSVALVYSTSHRLLSINARSATYIMQVDYRYRY